MFCVYDRKSIDDNNENEIIMIKCSPRIPMLGQKIRLANSSRLKTLRQILWTRVSRPVSAGGSETVDGEYNHRGRAGQED